MGVEWANLAVDTGMMGLAALSVCGLGRSGLGARTSRLALGRRFLALRAGDARVPATPQEPSGGSILGRAILCRLPVRTWGTLRGFAGAGTAAA